ncbi:MAG: GIY-YIG nuclease family protein, partial [Treponema sp.]|nr:GIY-YIG nuclease family protein [Candidatus Treponema equifaecale]
EAKMFSVISTGVKNIYCHFDWSVAEWRNLLQQNFSPTLEMTIKMEKTMNEYYVYIMASKENSVIYIGMTNDLTRRVQEHKSGLIEGFTQKYNVHKLVYFEKTLDATAAIAREKQLKKWRREKKNILIESLNPSWNDLAESL